MHSRDMYGNTVYGIDRRKERRNKRRRAENWRVACVAIVIIIALAIAAAYSTWRFSHVSAKSTKPKVQEGYEVRYVPLFRTETNDGTIEWFDAIDPDTGLHLLVNDRGGCMYRLDEFCNVMGEEYDE